MARRPKRAETSLAAGLSERIRLVRAAGGIRLQGIIRRRSPGMKDRKLGLAHAIAVAVLMLALAVPSAASAQSAATDVAVDEAPADALMCTPEDAGTADAPLIDDEGLTYALSCGPDGVAESGDAYVRREKERKFVLFCKVVKGDKEDMDSEEEEDDYRSYKKEHKKVYDRKEHKLVLICKAVKDKKTYDKKDYDKKDYDKDYGHKKGWVVLIRTTRG
jgi:hypothetical protein